MTATVRTVSPPVPSAANPRCARQAATAHPSTAVWCLAVPVGTVHRPEPTDHRALSSSASPLSPLPLVSGRLSASLVAVLASPPLPHLADLGKIGPSGRRHRDRGHHIRHTVVANPLTTQHVRHWAAAPPADRVPALQLHPPNGRSPGCRSTAAHARPPAGYTAARGVVRTAASTWLQGLVLDPLKEAALRMPGGEGVVRVPADLLCGLTPEDFHHDGEDVSNVER